MDHTPSAARLLRDARWMIGLTQEEVAQRAGTTRQVISSYESGLRSPSIGTLERLLAGCGLRLRLSAVPEPGLEDAPTLELLERQPLDRIDFPLQDAIVDVAESVGDPRLMLVSGKTAARLQGACVTVEEVELWFSHRQPLADIRGWLAAAAIIEPFPLTAADLQDGITLGHGPQENTGVLVRRVEHFDGFLSRSHRLGLPRPEVEFVNVAAADDCCLGWHPRDRDHLALQRAIRLASGG